MKHIRGVIFDIDGTLIDSNDQHAQAWLDGLRAGGFTIPYETVRPMIGMGGDGIMPRLTGHSKESPIGKQVTKAEGDAFKTRYESTVRAFPQVRALLQQMCDRGLRLAIATSAKPEELEKLLEIAGIADLIETKASSGDAERSKPDPGIVQVALDSLDLAPDEVLMIGDTPYDVEAAGKLDIRTLAVRCGGHDDAALVGALAIYADPADLLAHYDESPLAKGIAAKAEA